MMVSPLGYVDAALGFRRTTRGSRAARW